MRRLGLLLLTGLLAGTACSSGAAPAASSSPASSTTPASSTPQTSRPAPPSGAVVTFSRVAPSSDPATPTVAAPTSSEATTRAQQIFAGMTDAQRVGQLLMVGCPSTSGSSTTVSAIRSYHVGSVILDGNSTLSLSQQHAITNSLQSHAPVHTKLFIATDQEGGLVRRMRGPGFSAMPSALTQGSYPITALQADAKRWAGQLKAAGINVDLAPVLDTVPPGTTSNPPIGDLDREYGHYTSVVNSHGNAVVRGFAAAGIVATVKHFPGLGRVSANTDTTSGVIDSITTSTDTYLNPFDAAIEGGVPFVMMSTAIYSRIASGPAAFSPHIVTDILRGRMGFHGVVISDDLGAAKQVSRYPVGERAWLFIRAGGDIVLTVDPTQAGTMTSAILARMRLSPTFKNKVYASVLRVLDAKQAHGLLP